MNGWKALIWKDLRLFLSGTGIVTLLFPLVLLLSLQFGSDALLQQAYLEPFPIAVRDEDQTVMSRALIGQIEAVELFSEVVRAKDGATDRELLQQGCVAVITIPADYFYDLYDMEQEKIPVVLNGRRPLEASLFSSVITSVMEILSAEQSVGRAVFAFCYGDLGDNELRMMWQATSTSIIAHALGRQRVFAQTTAGADLAESMGRGFLACTLSVICLFFPLASVKTIPEERNLGMLQRYRSAGGSLWAFIGSRCLSAALLAAPALAMVLLAFRTEHWFSVAALTGVVFFGACGLLLCIAALAKEPGAAQRWSNLLLLVSLMFGGVLYPAELLPDAAQKVGPLTLPYYLRQGLARIDAGAGWEEIMELLWPVIVLGVVSMAAAGWAIRGKTVRIRRRTRDAAGGSGLGDSEPACGLRFSGFGPRLFGTTVRKVLAMSGGWLGLVLLLASVSVCGWAAAEALATERPDHLRVAVSVEESGALAEELVSYLEAQDGVSVVRVSPSEGRTLLERGRAEGLLAIGAGYEEAIRSDGKVPLLYESASASVSSEALREMVAGHVTAELAGYRGLRDAEERLERPLTAEERNLLRMQMEEERREAVPLYEIRTLNGGAASAARLAMPEAMGFTALAVMISLFTWGTWCGQREARLVGLRMRSLPGGRRLACGSDVLSLAVIGILTGLGTMLPAGLPGGMELVSLAAYVWCVAGLTYLLVRKTFLSGRVDVLAPFLALITSLLGGCFGSLAQVSPTLRTLSLMTPQGLLLRGQSGEWRTSAALCIAGCLCVWLGSIGKEEA